MEPVRLKKDEQRDAGYLPGYRAVPSLGMSPWSPSVGALPGGLTPGFAAPMPPNDWTFQFTGFMNVTAQFGLSKRPTPAPGQSDTVAARAAQHRRRVPVVRQHLAPCPATGSR